MKQRIVCLLLAAVLLLQLSGCKQPDTQAEPKDKESVSKPDCYGWEALSEELGIRFLKPSGSSDVFVEAPLGSVEGKTYTNPYLGFSFTVDPKWTVVPAEDLQDLTGLTKDMLSESDFGQYIASVPQYFDVMAMSKDGKHQINILYEKQPGFLEDHFGNMSEEEFIDTLLASDSVLKETYAAANMEVLEMQKKTVTFLGEPHFALYTSAELAGQPIYLIQLADFSLFPYSVSITVGCITEDRTQEILQYFSPI